MNCCKGCGTPLYNPNQRLCGTCAQEAAESQRRRLIEAVPEPQETASTPGSAGAARAESVRRLDEAIDHYASGFFNATEKMRLIAVLRAIADLLADRARSEPVPSENKRSSETTGSSSVEQEAEVSFGYTESGVIFRNEG